MPMSRNFDLEGITELVFQTLERSNLVQASIYLPFKMISLVIRILLLSREMTPLSLP